MSQEAYVGLVVMLIFIGTVIAQAIGGHHATRPHSWRDRGFALAGLASQLLLCSPVIAFVIALLFARLFPHSAGALAQVSFWIVFPVAFFLQEFCHYWLHRRAHEKRWLWRLQRTHYSAPQLNALVLYRNDVLWTLLLPQTWAGMILLHLGQTEAFAACVLIEFSVNALTHSPFRYAVSLFFLDVLYCTARIPRARQERFGLPARFDWKEELLWPVLRKRTAKPQ